MAGISLALGAFLAGLIVAGSEFRHQAMSDLIPVREAFASLFFVSVGMLLDVSEVLAHLPPTLGLCAVILAGKVRHRARDGPDPSASAPRRNPVRGNSVSDWRVFVRPPERRFRNRPPRRSTVTITSFSRSSCPCCSPPSPSPSPLTLRSVSPRIPWLNRILDAEPPGIDTHEPHSDHVIVAGYGRAGRGGLPRGPGRGIRLRCGRRQRGQRPQRRTRPETWRCTATSPRREVLEELGCRDARLVVVTINDTRATEVAVRAIRRAAPDTRVIARTMYDMDVRRRCAPPAPPASSRRKRPQATSLSTRVSKS